MAAIKLGINMAGAASAGAYTAGVLDFLIQALDEWYAAKAAGEDVPRHDVSIEVISGASAGGMCAAIAGTQIQESFDHITDTSQIGSNNRFYESWVNKIDIRELLKTSDLGSGKSVVSLLDSDIIEQIASYALAPEKLQPRSYVSSHLTIFLTLTNIRGVPYLLSSDQSGSVEEYTAWYGDRLRFEVVQPGQAPVGPNAKPLPAGRPGEGAWPLLQQAAMATGAVPVILAPRTITRDTDDYYMPLWQPVDTKVSEIPPKWDYQKGQTWTTVNVDGGVTDNNPFDLALEHLRSLDPPVSENPGDSLQVDRVVLSVAPFPASNSFNPKFDPEKSCALGSAFLSVVNVMLSQSRFLGESLGAITSGDCFDRLVIAPSDPDGAPNGAALQCAPLSAFAGFFDRGFRAHDFQLGRRNCQRFLEARFLLPQNNPIIKQGMGLNAHTILSHADYGKQPPTREAQPADEKWIPVIPLCGSAKTEVPEPVRVQISDENLNEITKLITHRAKALLPGLLKGFPSQFAKLVIEGEIMGYLLTVAPGELKKYLRAQL
ncbi:MAG TPA: patatin-like phospholipase family protein [Bryobacteraceae bacterium]|nr:patatin-like phospholipase family protein [Bryobacteraceae bacterium]